MTTIRHACDIARQHVQIISEAVHQHRVTHWSNTHRAWWEGERHYDYRAAVSAAREYRICTALEILEVDDAASIAHFATEEPGDWRTIVARKYLDYLSALHSEAA